MEVNPPKQEHLLALKGERVASRGEGLLPRVPGGAGSFSRTSAASVTALPSPPGEASVSRLVPSGFSPLSVALRTAPGFGFIWSVRIAW